MVAVEDAMVERFLTLAKEYPQITQIKNEEKEQRRTETIPGLLLRCCSGVSSFPYSV
jgi:hypothetical protein